MDKYVDIHTHTYYHSPDTVILLNVFARDTDKMESSAFKSVGLHPWHIEQNTWESDLGRVENAIGSTKVIAVGEAGLDKTIKTDYTLQNEVFRQHLKISEQSRKPLIIHCVRSYSEMLSYRKQSDQSVPWIFHWFNADRQIANELIRKNCYLSFGHMLFNEQSRAFRTFPEVPAENMFFETDDAGYSISEVYDRAALLLNIPASDLKTHIMDNFARCFEI